MMRQNSKYVLLIFFLLNVGFAKAQTRPLSWDKWQLLIGPWEAVGHGSPGEGKGGLSFTFDLQNKVIIRKSHTDYPAAGGRPAFAHDDLMVICADDGLQKFRADYYDNERHVIRYTIEFSPDGQGIIFLSDLIPSQPRFRLTYERRKGDDLNIKFEIAPPISPERLQVYVEGTARKK